MKVIDLDKTIEIIIFEGTLEDTEDKIVEENTGGSCLSHTVVKPDSHLTWVFVAKFLCIIKLIIIIA